MVDPALPCLSHGNRSEVSGLNLSLTPAICLLTPLPRPHVAPHGMGPVSKTYGYNKLCFSEPLLHLVLWLHLTDHPIKEYKAPTCVILFVLPQE